MSIRTDIAIEMHENIKKKSQSGVNVKRWKKEKVEIVKVEITNTDGEKSMNKPIGKYYTLDLPEFSHESELTDFRLSIVTDIVRELLPENAEKFLIAGLGNDNITPDALGPLCAKRIFATRHFENFAELKQNLPDLNPVSSISTGVLGQTGIETSEYINGIVKFVNPDVVIIVDALASSNVSSLGKTVQLSNTGITPGSGVGNYRKRIDESSLGVPVISIGVPTVVGLEDDEDMLVTPKDIDTIVSRAANFLALSINCAVQPSLEPEMFLALS